MYDNMLAIPCEYNLEFKFKYTDHKQMLRNYYHYIHMSICMKNISVEKVSIQGDLMNDIERASLKVDI